MNKHNYVCDCFVGNISIAETEMMKESLISQLLKFH